MKKVEKLDNFETPTDKVKKVTKKVMKYVKIGLFITMLVLIFIASPRITQLIKDGANYIYNADSNIITRIVELVLSVITLGFVMRTKKK